MKKIASLIVVSCLLSGCFMSSMFSGDGGTVDMTYNCSPAGATIVEQGGNRLGTCPVTVQYYPNSDQLKEGKFYTKKLTAVWADGTVASVPSLTVDIQASHTAQYTFMNSTETQQVAWNGPDKYPPPPAPPPPPQSMQPAPPPPYTDNSVASSAPMPLNDQPVSSGRSDYSMQASEAATAATLPPPEPPAGAIEPPVDRHQDQDFFDGFNRKVTCGINNVIDSARSGCTPDSGF